MHVLKTSIRSSIHYIIVVMMLMTMQSKHIHSLRTITKPLSFFSYYSKSGLRHKRSCSTMQSLSHTVPISSSSSEPISKRIEYPTAHTRAAIEQFRKDIQGQLLLAPLSRGGNVPFRKLCAEFGANFTMSEMAYSKNLASSNGVVRRGELVLAKRNLNEKYFGLQIATKASSEALAAYRNVLNDKPEDGSAETERSKKYMTGNITWLDINCGCPTYEASHRGLGAIMLQSPNKIERLVRMLITGSPKAQNETENLSHTTLSEPTDSVIPVDIPITVKIRLGVSNSKKNCFDVVKRLASAGVAAVIVHGRTMEQRYTRPADWDIITQLARTYRNQVPIIGNGDILTWYEAEDRMNWQPARDAEEAVGDTEDESTKIARNMKSSGPSGVSALMTGRGALIKPWIFKEWQEKKCWNPSLLERVNIYWTLGQYYREYCGTDERGKKSAFYFFPWHFNFFCRYRPLPEDVFRPISREVPLIQNSRMVDDKLREIGLMTPLDYPEGTYIDGDGSVDKLLRLTNPKAHLAIAEALWHAPDVTSAMASLESIAKENLSSWVTEVHDRDLDSSKSWSTNG